MQIKIQEDGFRVNIFIISNCAIGFIRDLDGMGMDDVSLI
jgi:hypothetical protein